MGARPRDSSVREVCVRIQFAEARDARPDGDDGGVLREGTGGASQGRGRREPAPSMDTSGYGQVAKETGTIWVLQLNVPFVLRYSVVKNIVESLLGSRLIAE